MTDATAHDPDDPSPVLSVVVTVVEGGDVLARCLEALAAQDGAPAMEVLVPYDDSIGAVAELAERFPAFRFLSLGSLRDPQAGENPFTEHALFDRRRAAGLHAARGRFVAMVEDRGRPYLDWARQIVGLIEGSDYAAVGGAVENGADNTLLWAVYFCDFGRYQPPLDVVDPEYITDVNICYTREALESVADLWTHEYQEARVNWALRGAGRHLYLSDRPRVVEERPPIGLVKLLSERFHWARLFGQIRGRETSRVRSALWAVVTPALPFVLSARHFRRQLQKKHHVGRFITAIPAIFSLLAFWAMGECLGYCEATIRRTPR